MAFVDSHGIELTNKFLSQALPQVKHGTDFVRIWSFLRNLHLYVKRLTNKYFDVEFFPTKKGVSILLLHISLF